MIEPGLMLRVGPTSDANSVLEFVMDPNHDRGDRYDIEAPSTGKLSFSKSSKNKPHQYTFSHTLFICTSRKLKSDFATNKTYNFISFHSFFVRKQNLHMF